MVCFNISVLSPFKVVKPSLLKRQKKEEREGLGGQELVNDEGRDKEAVTEDKDVAKNYDGSELEAVVENEKVPTKVKIRRKKKLIVSMSQFYWLNF